MLNVRRSKNVLHLEIEGLLVTSREALLKCSNAYEARLWSLVLAHGAAAQCRTAPLKKQSKWVFEKLSQENIVSGH